MKAANWTKDAKGWRLPSAKQPLSLEVLSPTEASNPGLYAAAEAVVRDWTALGLTAKHVALPPAEFVGGAAGHRDVPGRGRRPAHRARPRPLPAARLEPDADRRVERHRRPVGRARHTAREGPRARFGERPEGRLQRAAEGAGGGSIPASAGLRGRGRRGPRHGRGACDPAGHRRVGSILGCANMAPRRRPVTVGRGPCRGGGIGRRAGFRYQWPQGRVGSSPSLGTTPSDSFIPR